MGFIKKQRKKLEGKARDKILESVPTLKLEKEALDRLNKSFAGINWNEKVIRNDIKNGKLTEDSLEEYIEEAGRDVTVLRAIDERVKDPILNKQVQDLRNSKEIDYSNYEEFLDKLPEMQKNELLETRELIIYRSHTIKAASTSVEMRPKGITDIIGGAYGNTAINMERRVKHNPAKVKWVEDKLIITNDGFTISSTGEGVLYDNIDSINVNKSSPSDMGFPVSVHLKNNVFFTFRTPITIGFETLIKEKIGDDSPSTSITEDIFGTLKKQIDTNQNNSQEPSSNNEENSSSNADELMKYAELYEKGLLTEEEFNAKKKELLGL